MWDYYVKSYRPSWSVFRSSHGLHIKTVSYICVTWIIIRYERILIINPHFRLIFFITNVNQHHQSLWLLIITRSYNNLIDTQCKLSMISVFDPWQSLYHQTAKSLLFTVCWCFEDGTPHPVASSVRLTFDSKF